jgi:hypothetical protein
MKIYEENIKKKENYNQVCVWPGVLVKDDKENDFEQFIFDNFNETRIQFLETIITLPDKKDGNDVEGTGGRHDVFFAVHKDDIGKFTVPRLIAGIRWIEDVLSRGNYQSPIYPKRVFEYKTW